MVPSLRNCWEGQLSFLHNACVVTGTTVSPVRKSYHYSRVEEAKRVQHLLSKQGHHRFPQGRILEWLLNQGIVGKRLTYDQDRVESGMPLLDLMWGRYLLWEKGPGVWAYS